MIKLIASDMDGTLLDRKHQISDENLEAIRTAQKMGVKFAIATGRDYESVRPVLQQYGIKCECIVMNGAEYRGINGEVIESIKINKDHVKIIIDTFHSAGLSADILTNDGLYASNKELSEIAFKERRQSFIDAMTEEEIIEFEKQFKHIFNPKYVDSVTEFLNSELEIYKIMTFNRDEKLISDVKDKLREIKDLAVASTFSTDIEITHITAQKGIILAKVIEKNGFERDEVMVLGDSFNDYSMFEEFNNSFAMGNAIPEIKKIARYITDTNDNAGVAKAVYKMIK